MDFDFDNRFDDYLDFSQPKTEVEAVNAIARYFQTPLTRKFYDGAKSWASLDWEELHKYAENKKPTRFDLLPDGPVLKIKERGRDNISVDIYV